MCGEEDVAGTGNLGPHGNPPSQFFMVSLSRWSRIDNKADWSPEVLLYPCKGRISVPLNSKGLHAAVLPKRTDLQDSAEEFPGDEGEEGGKPVWAVKMYKIQKLVVPFCSCILC